MTSMGWLGWALLSAVFSAATALLAKIGVKDLDANAAAAIRTSVVVVFTWIVAFALRPAGGFGSGLGRDWIFLVLSGLGTGLSWLCYFRALSLGEASKVAPVDKLSVALVILCSTLVLGERLTWAKAVGGGLIVAGAIVVAKS